MADATGDTKAQTAEQLWRHYGRQLALPEWGEPAQLRLQHAKVLLIGAGGLGSAVATYLVAAGIGQLDISDGDQVSLSNLQRQFLYGVADLGLAKNRRAQQRLQQLNPQVQIRALPAVDPQQLPAWLATGDYQLVADCCDNQATRLVVNQACLEAQIPLLSAAVSGWQGSVALFDFSCPSSVAERGCYACLYPYATAEDCRQLGILGATAGVVATTQALEALKFLAGLPTPSDSRVLRFDALGQRWRQLARQRDRDCACCGTYLCMENH